MKTMLIILLFGITCMCTISCSRDVIGSQKNILDLKKCALLIRLNDLADKAEKLRSAGNEYKAEAVEKHQTDNNLAIVTAFNNNFDFSKIYYFLSSDTDKIKAGNYKGIFLGPNLERDTSIELACDSYLIGDFGVIDPDSNTDMANKWIIKDQNFDQLKKPFPYHVKFIDCLFAGGLDKEIECLNKKMHSYYKKVAG